MNSPVVSIASTGFVLFQIQDPLASPKTLPAAQGDAEAHKVDRVRLLHFLLLAAVLLTAYFAQHIFDQRSMAGFFPAGWLSAWPVLYRLNFWLPADLIRLALWLSALSSLAFGWLAPPWPTAVWPRLRRSNPDPTVDGKGTLAAAGLAVGLCLTGLVTLLLATGHAEQRWMHLAWPLGMVSYVVGAAWMLPRRREPANQEESRGRTLLPLLLILGGAFFLFTHQWIDVPVRVDIRVAELGLQARAELAAGWRQLFQPVEEGQLPLAYLTTGLGIWLTGDNLLGIRLAGLLAGVLATLATWLVGREIFRRVPLYGPYGEWLEDDGRWLCWLAAALFATNYATLHFSRLPLHMEVVAWGSLGLWALARGVRTGSGLSLAGSGVLLGVASLLHPSGLALVAVGGAWWVGVWLLGQGWPTQVRGRGRSRLLTWLGGVAVALGPWLGTWMADPQRLLGYLFQAHLWTTASAEGTPAGLWPLVQQSAWLNLRLGLLTFNLLPDQSPWFGYPGALLGSLVAPLFVLAVGGLLLNLDRWPGWSLVTWLMGALIGYALLAPGTVQWTWLLPALPAAMLAVAFGVDRIRVMLMHDLGTWSGQAFLYVMLGLVIGVGLFNWVDYYQFVQSDDDLASYVGRVIRETGEQTPVLLLGQVDAQALWTYPTVTFLANGRLPQRLEMPDEGWNARSLPPGTRVLITADDPAALVAVEQYYPGGTLAVYRNQHNNPILYVYDLPPARPGEQTSGPREETSPREAAIW